MRCGLHLALRSRHGRSPVHVHEFSDRLLVGTSGIGLFYYLPDAGHANFARSSWRLATRYCSREGPCYVYGSVSPPMPPFFEFGDATAVQRSSEFRSVFICTEPGSISLAAITGRGDTGP